MSITGISFNVIMFNYEYYGNFFQFPHRRCTISFMIQLDFRLFPVRAAHEKS